jgi:hypothetical protein
MWESLKNVAMQRDGVAIILTAAVIGFAAGMYAMKLVN